MPEPKVTVDAQEITMTVFTVKCDSCSFSRTVADPVTAHDLRASHEEGHRDGDRLGEVTALPPKEQRYPPHDR